MEEYTREQIQRADDTDLYVFLSGRGEQFKRCGKEYRWLRHDSVMINKNEWYRFSQNKGGHAIDFMKEFYGRSFAEAVKELLGEEGDRNKRTAKEDAGRQKVCPCLLYTSIISVVKLTPDGTGYRTKMIFVKEKLLMDRMSDIQLRFFNIG